MIIIVGGGIVGLALGLALAKAGTEILLIESAALQASFPNQDDPFDAKVVAINRFTENFFKHIDVWQAIEQARICSYQHMQVWDSVLNGAIEFSAVDFFEKDLGHIVEQRVIVAALLSALQSQPKVTLLPAQRVQSLQFSDKFVTLTTDQQAYQATLVVGADGAQSTIRRLCGISSTAWEYEQTAIVATIQTEQPHRQTAYQRFASDGPLALLPLQDPFLCSIVWTTSPANAQALYQDPAIVFNEKLSHASQHVLGKLALNGKRYIFDLRTHHANRYAIERCVLIGDAAHTLHPLAGQGVNLGIQDASALAQVIAKATAQQLDIGTLKVLKQYERQRKLHNQIMIWAMELFKRGFGSQFGLIQRIRNIGLNWVDNHLSLKQIFAKLALGTFIEKGFIDGKKDKTIRAAL